MTTSAPSAVSVVIPRSSATPSTPTLDPFAVDHVYVQLNIIAAVTVICPFALTVFLCIYHMRDRCTSCFNLCSRHLPCCSALFSRLCRSTDVYPQSAVATVTGTTRNNSAVDGQTGNGNADAVRYSIVAMPPPPYDEALSMPLPVRGRLVRFYAGSSLASVSFGTSGPVMAEGGGERDGGCRKSMVLQCTFTMTDDWSCKPPTYEGFVEAVEAAEEVDVGANGGTQRALTAVNGSVEQVPGEATVSLPVGDELTVAQNGESVAIEIEERVDYSSTVE